MSNWVYYNPNPKGIKVGDCAIRAISKALDTTWEDAYIWLTCYGYNYADLPSSNYVWGSFLKEKGYKRFLVDDKGADKYTVSDFCNDNPVGTYVLAIQGHVVCVVDGKYFDTWDSGEEIPIYYWRRDVASSKME